MMMRTRLVLAIVLAGCGCRVFGQAPSADVQASVDSFAAAEPQNWRGLNGSWAVEAGAYRQREPGAGGYCYTVRDLSFEPSLLRVRATPLQQNSLGFLSFGIVLRYADAENWAAVRFGSYGGISLLELVRGEKRITQMGKCTPEREAAHDVAVARFGERIALFLNGTLTGLARLHEKRGLACVGLFTECDCRFDDFRAGGAPDAWETFKHELLAADEHRQQALASARRGAAALPNGVFEDSFDAGETGLWETVKGTWKWRNSRLEMASTGWGRFVALAPAEIEDGTVSGTASARAKSVHGHGVFGVIVKWIDSANWIAVRIGQYGNAAVFAVVDGEQKITSLAPFETVIGQEYTFSVTLAGDCVTASCAGRVLGKATVPFAGQAGRPGLYTEAETAFDTIRIAGARPLPTDQPEPLPGTPRIGTEFCTSRWGEAGDGTGRPDSKGIIHVYVRNRGTGPAELVGVQLDGQEATNAQDIIAWVRQRPARIAPGELGEVTIALDRLPLRPALRLFEDPASNCVLPLSLEFNGGVHLETSFQPVVDRAELRINHVAFSSALDRMWVYLQRCPDTADDSPCRFGTLELNGHDVTPRCTWGTPHVGPDVVPVEVALPSPLRNGKPVVIVVRTVDGQYAARSLRAFPAEFPIQVTLLGKQTRPDAVEDIFRHHATCIGLCGADTDRLKEAKTFGLKAFHYGRGGLSALQRFARPEFPEIAGFWLDEMDKLPIRDTAERIRESELAYRRLNRFIPPQMVNLCAGVSARSVLYYELADIACSAYGFHGGSLGKGFGRLSALPAREYRLARRPFMPYLRDAELGVVIDPERGEVVGRVPEYRRCIEPGEERWMTYACLIQGAKGIMHWNYGSGIQKPPNWFSKEKTVLRAGMGGALEHDPHGYHLPEDVSRDLRAVWDEIGRINLELRAIGPLVANSDVSSLARVVASTPERSASGEPAVEAAALVSGLDTVVLIVLNQTIQTNWTGAADRGIKAYPPVNVTVELNLPPWLEPVDTFSVRHRGIAPVAPKREAGKLLFYLDDLAVSDVIVITERQELQASLTGVLATLLSGEKPQP